MSSALEFSTIKPAFPRWRALLDQVIQENLTFMSKKLLAHALLFGFLLGTLLMVLPSAVNAISANRIVGPEGPYTYREPPEPDIPSSPTGYEYTVQPGDDVWIIALAHGISMQALTEANGLAAPYLIHPGDKLWVPAEPATVSEELRQAQVPTPTPRPTPTPTASSPRPAITLATSDKTNDLSSGGQSSPPPDAGQWALLLFSLINEKRVQYKLPRLSWSAELAQSAQAHAEDMARRGWGSHVGSDGARLRTRLARAGYPARWAGENWVNVADPRTAFNWWWDEPPGADPHRQNILGPAYREIGIGIARGGYGYFFVADFGSR